MPMTVVRARAVTYGLIVGLPLLLLLFGVASNSAGLGRVLGTYAAVLLDPAAIATGLVLGMIHRKARFAAPAALVAIFVLSVFLSQAGPTRFGTMLVYVTWALASWVAIVGVIQEIRTFVAASQRVGH